MLFSSFQLFTKELKFIYLILLYYYSILYHSDSIKLLKMNSPINNLKRHVFFEFLNYSGRAFVLVRYSDNVVLGNRGFTAEEKKNGIVLVFSSKMNFLWDDYGITATLVFGTSPQKCFIPVDDIKAVYCPELNAEFLTSPPKQESGVQAKKQEAKAKDQTSENVIKVDFTKKRK